MTGVPSYLSELAAARLRDDLKGKAQTSKTRHANDYLVAKIYMVVVLLIVAAVTLLPLVVVVGSVLHAPRYSDPVMSKKIRAIAEDVNGLR